MLRNKSYKLNKIGITILRMGLGVMFIMHGYPKIFGGPDMWEQVGAAAKFAGLDFLPVFFGFMAGIAEFFGGISLLLGLFFRPALSLLIVVMVVATCRSIGLDAGFAMISHSIELGIVFISLLFIGPGPYSLDKKLSKYNRRRY